MKLIARYTLAGETKTLDIEGDKLTHLCAQFNKVPEDLKDNANMAAALATYELDFGGILSEEQEDNGIFATLLSWKVEP